MRDSEFLTPREQVLILKLLAAKQAAEHDPYFQEYDSKMGKTLEILELYKQIGQTVTEIAKKLNE
ncbi:hypothetical protein [Macromonas nakdongensis]|uniref:hypothetical protein n=1 Tax=Macromonas nakdongensis TaxID=1843082 RepID=UPI0012FF42A6|nr:hypothetical protein [Macromonas nakdongensis]